MPTEDRAFLLYDGGTILLQGENDTICPIIINLRSAYLSLPLTHAFSDTRVF